VSAEIPPSLPFCPKQTAFLLGNTLFLWSFIAALQISACLRPSVNAAGRDHGCQCGQQSHPTEEPEETAPSGHVNAV